MADVLKKVSMPEQDPKIRITNFSEVALGYTKEMAMEEASRCLHCANEPCVSMCPVNVAIPEFIQHIRDDDFQKAYEVIEKTNPLAAICGRVCPQETQCESTCVRAIKGESIAIGRLERFAADWYMKHGEKPSKNVEKNGKKVAVVGSGPASLTCAGDLAKMGYDVTVFEAFHMPGGVLVYGIPEFRLPKDIVESDINKLYDLGVKIRTNVVTGRTLLISDLFKDGFEAVFVGTGAGLPSFMGLEGENLCGVYSANEFLTRINLMKAYLSDRDTPVMVGEKVAVVGGGNVAMDAARCAKRMGAKEVYILYRRGVDEMPARNEEIEHALAEGIILKTLVNPVRIIGNDTGWVEKIECIAMEFGPEDDSGRRSPVPIEGSNFTIDMDTVIIAIGTSPNPLIKDTTEDLETNKWGCIVADHDTGQTSLEGVFAGGDIVTGSVTVILAMGAGKKSAIAIDEYLSK